MFNRIGPCDSLLKTHPKEYLELCEIFKNHPKYPDKCINQVDIKFDYHQNNNNLTTYIINQDGSIDSISVLKQCITGKPKNSQNQLIEAMRTYVEDQILTFKWAHKDDNCNICGSDSDLQVDHHSDYMPFCKLANDFQAINTISEPTNLTTKYTRYSPSVACFIDGDLYANAWSIYHQQNAVLRILCQKCNCKQHHQNNASSKSNK